MDYESYRQSILDSYGMLTSRYVLQDAEGFQPPSHAPELLFADQVLATWVPKHSAGLDSTRQRASSSQSVEQEKKTVEKYKVLEGLRKFSVQRVLLVGKPGAGKTTALQKLLIEEVQEGEQLTALIELRSVKTSVLQTVYDFFERHQLGLSLARLRQKLSQGQCLLLIDGINELPSASAQTDFRQFLKDYDRCPMVATTRDIELGGDFGIQKKLELQPLTPKQVTAFVRAYLTNEVESEQILKQLRPRFSDFQETPLLLLMLCAVFREDQQLPTNLGLAFRKFARLYDDQFKRGIKNLGHSRPILSYLAFKMIVGQDKLSPLLVVEEREAVEWLTERAPAAEPYAWAEAWLAFLLKHHLLQRRHDGKIEFKHQLWQEYYAAEYLVDYIPQLDDELVKQNFLNLLKWTESLKLMQALMDDCHQALRIARLALETDLLLGATLSGMVKKSFEQQSVTQLKSYPFSIQWRHVGWRPWLLSQVKNMLLLIVLPRTASRSVVPILSSCVDSLSPSVRCRTANALEELGGNEAVTLLIGLLQDRDWSVRLSAAEALGVLGNDAAIEPLIGALRDNDLNVCLSAAKALGVLGGDTAIKTLLGFLKDGDSYVRRSAARALVELDREEVIAPLIDSLQDGNNEVRRNATYILGEIGGGAVKTPLLSLLHDSDSSVRFSAAYALVELDRDEAIASLIDLLQESEVRRRAAYVLGELGRDEAVVPLIELSQDSNHSVRRRAANALGELGGDEAIASLRALLRDSNVSVRRCAVKALVKLGREDALEPLIRLLQNSNSHVRLYSAEALRELGGDKVVKSLVELSQDSDIYVRFRAAQALCELGGDEAVAPLIRLLQDDSYYVRHYAANALGRLGGDEAVASLAGLLKGSDRAMRRSVAEALSELGCGLSISALWQYQLQARSLYAGVDYTYQIESVQNRCQFYNDLLYQQPMLPLPSLSPFHIPSPEPIRGITMSTNNINFSGANIGAVNIDSTVTSPQIGTQHNYAPEQDIAKAAADIQALLQQLQQTHSSDMSTAVQSEIRTNANFYERLCFMLQAGAFETLKAIFPPVGIPIEMVKAWVEAKPVEQPKEGLPPGGF